MFGLGRMIRSLADKQQAPKWLKDERNVPRRGILFSGFSMLAALGFGLLFPSVYLFLISSGGFAILFTYAVIISPRYGLEKNLDAPLQGSVRCQAIHIPHGSYFLL
jgi:L-asparagine transporter-like permease